MPSDDPTSVSRQEHESLKRDVRSLERQVDTLKEQLASVRRQVRTDTGVDDTEGADEQSDSTVKKEVPVSAEAREAVSILREMNADDANVEVDKILQKGAEAGHLRSSVKATLRSWLNEGYLVGDLDRKVSVAEWPPETQEV